MKRKKLTFIGSQDMSKAIGFFWDGCHKIFVASSEDDRKLFPDLELRPMEEIAACYTVGCALKSIVWCGSLKPIAVRGVYALTFWYSDGSKTLVQNKAAE